MAQATAASVNIVPAKKPAMAIAGTSDKTSQRFGMHRGIIAREIRQIMSGEKVCTMTRSLCVVLRRALFGTVALLAEERVIVCVFVMGLLFFVI